MTHFLALTNEKQRLRKAILNNQNIVNLLVNTGDNTDEYQDIRTGSKSPASKLVKSHFYVPGTEQEGRNYISMRSRIVYPVSTHVKQVVLVVYIICNEDQIDLLQGSRADLIAHELDQMVNHWQDPLFGLGGVKVSGAEEVQFNNGYSGWEISYSTYERNRNPEVS